MRSAVFVGMVAGVAGGWLFTYLSQRAGEFIDRQLEDAERSYKRNRAGSPIYDALVCEGIDARFERGEL